MVVRVFHKRTNVERTVTKKAYEILKSQYTFIRYENEDGTLPGAPPATKVETAAQAATAPTQKKSVEAVETEKITVIPPPLYPIKPAFVPDAPKRKPGRPFKKKD